MKTSVLWATPDPEKTIALAMRRCYSTKTLSELVSELESKGPDYWKHLIGLAIRDKSFDVIEHFCILVLLEDLDEKEIFSIILKNPFIRFTYLKPKVYLASLNARTLIEMIHQDECKELALSIIKSLKDAGIGNLFISVVFGGMLIEG
jgi:hypothetical protein